MKAAAVAKHKVRAAVVNFIVTPNAYWREIAKVWYYEQIRDEHEPSAKSIQFLFQLVEDVVYVLTTTECFCIQKRRLTVEHWSDDGEKEQPKLSDVVRVAVYIKPITHPHKSTYIIQPRWWPIAVAYQIRRKDVPMCCDNQSKLRKRVNRNQCLFYNILVLENILTIWNLWIKT